MKAWMAALIGASRTRKTLAPITSSTTFVVPYGVSSLDLTGYGAAGTPGTPGTPGQTGWHEVSITTFQRRDGGTDQTASTFPPVFDGSPKPDNYCDPTVTYTTDESTVYSSSTTCYSFFTDTQPGTPGTAATTGASTTAFGKTFPGGAGGPASPTSFTNVTVTGGSSYSIVVPAGGSLTISYYQ